MAFPTQGGRTPTTIGTMLITFQDPDGVAGNRTARFSIEVLDQIGATMTTLTGNLVPHLSGAQINALQSFLNTLRTQAEGEILP